MTDLASRRVIIPNTGVKKDDDGKRRMITDIMNTKTVSQNRSV